MNGKKINLIFTMYIMLSLNLNMFAEEQSNNEIITIHVDKKPIVVEIANTPEKRRLGLMYRKQMKENHGMLFIFPDPDYLNFWMKNTYIPLSIAFFNRDRRLINIHKMKANQTRELYGSKELAIYALEVNQGWFEKNNIKPFSVLKLPKVIEAK